MQLLKKACKYDPTGSKICRDITKHKSVTAKNEVLFQSLAQESLHPDSWLWSRRTVSDLLFVLSVILYWCANPGRDQEAIPSPGYWWHQHTMSGRGAQVTELPWHAALAAQCRVQLREFPFPSPCVTSWSAAPLMSIVWTPTSIPTVLLYIHWIIYGCIKVYNLVFEKGVLTFGLCRLLGSL